MPLAPCSRLTSLERSEISEPWWFRRRYTDTTRVTQLIHISCNHRHFNCVFICCFSPSQWSPLVLFFLISWVVVKVALTHIKQPPHPEVHISTQFVSCILSLWPNWLLKHTNEFFNTFFSPLWAHNLIISSVTAALLHWGLMRWRRQAAFGTSVLSDQGRRYSLPRSGWLRGPWQPYNQ